MARPLRISVALFGSALAFVDAACGAPQPALRVERAPSAAVIPVRIDAATPIVEVEIGAHTLRLILDLGGFDTISLTPEAAVRVGAAFTGAERNVLNAYGKPSQSREYRLDEVRLGKVRLRDVVGYEFHGTRAEASGAPLDGYLGLGVLRSFHTAIDLPHERLVLASGAALPGEYTRDLVATTRCDVGGNGVRSALLVDGKELHVVWDTGASRSILRTAAIPAGRPDRVVSRGPLRVYEADAIVAGGRGLGQLGFVLIDFKEPDADAIVGHDFFAKHVVIVDFEKETLAIR